MSLPCFKAYDIRGRIPDELNEKLAYRIGRAYANSLAPSRVVVGRDVRLEHRDPTPRTGAHELKTQSALADSRVAHHPHNLSLARKGTLQCPFEELEFLLPPHERGEPAGLGKL